MGVLAVLVIVVIIGWVGFTQVAGRQQVDVHSPDDLATTRRRVNELFGIAWSPAEGRGDDNFRPRLRAYAPTISVAYSSSGSGTDVSIWCSDFSTRYGIMAHAQLMWRKSHSVARAIARDSTPAIASDGAL